MLTHAIVRPPGRLFADGLTTSTLGRPDYEIALQQHEAYCRALERCGLTVIRLDPDEDHPDSTFIEDDAVITGNGIVLARPGAPARRQEIPILRRDIAEYFGEIMKIDPPGTLDGGDVCQAGNTWFIGISGRTNEEGARQLANLIGKHGGDVMMIDIRGRTDHLHLKSGLAWLGDGRLIAADDILGETTRQGYRIIPVSSSELYAANCVRVNNHVLFAAGFPELEGRLRDAGDDLLLLEMTEFQKMDGGISCLSLRFTEAAS